MFGIIKKATDTLTNVAEDPIGACIDTVTQPLRDGIEVLEGLTEGELRAKAAARLGADAAGGMALNELIEWYTG